MNTVYTTRRYFSRGDVLSKSLKKGDFFTKLSSIESKGDISWGTSKWTQCTTEDIFYVSGPLITCPLGGYPLPGIFTRSLSHTHSHTHTLRVSCAQ